MDTSTLHTVAPENAARIAGWLKERGGVAVWASANLANVQASWSTPALDLDGKTPTPRPSWQAAYPPERIITDPAEVVVEEATEVRRFHVAVRRSGLGLTLKLTDASTAKVRRAVEAWEKRRADHRAWYAFDYSTQEAVIYVAGAREPLTSWLARNTVEV